MQKRCCLLKLRIGYSGILIRRCSASRRTALPPVLPALIFGYDTSSDPRVTAVGVYLKADVVLGVELRANFLRVVGQAEIVAYVFARDPRYAVDELQHVELAWRGRDDAKR